MSLYTYIASDFLPVFFLPVFFYQYFFTILTLDRCLRVEEGDLISVDLWHSEEQHPVILKEEKLPKEMKSARNHDCQGGNISLFNLSNVFFQSVFLTSFWVQILNFRSCCTFCVLTFLMCWADVWHYFHFLDFNEKKLNTKVSQLLVSLEEGLWRTKKVSKIRQTNATYVTMHPLG